MGGGGRKRQRRRRWRRVDSTAVPSGCGRPRATRDTLSPSNPTPKLEAAGRSKLPGRGLRALHDIPPGCVLGARGGGRGFSDVLNSVRTLGIVWGLRTAACKENSFGDVARLRLCGQPRLPSAACPAERVRAPSGCACIRPSDTPVTHGKLREHERAWSGSVLGALAAAVPQRGGWSGHIGPG